MPSEMGTKGESQKNENVEGKSKAIRKKKKPAINSRMIKRPGTGESYSNNS